MPRAAGARQQLSACRARAARTPFHAAAVEVTVHVVSGGGGC